MSTEPTTPKQVTPADVAAAAARPSEDAAGTYSQGVRLSEEQRARVEALHAARRVLGSQRTADGQIPAAWAWQAIELADYILTGEITEIDDDEEDEDEEHPAGLPTGIILSKGATQEEAVAFIRDAVQRVTGTPSPEVIAERVRNVREFVDSYRDKPDGYTELHAQGFYPVDGSEPPRDEPLHDVHCRRWTFNATTGRWTRQILPSEVTGTPSAISAAWGSALAEHGPFHVCV